MYQINCLVVKKKDVLELKEIRRLGGQLRVNKDYKSALVLCNALMYFN